MKITIIGAGNMGGAIAKGLAKVNITAEGNITCTAKSGATLDKLRETCPQMRLTTNNREAVEGADIVIFAVKPWLMKEVIEQVYPALDAMHQIYISVAAGISCDELEDGQLHGCSRKPVGRMYSPGILWNCLCNALCTGICPRGR